MNLKGLAPELRSVHLLNGENKLPAYKAVNPQGFVPFLVEGEGDNRFELSQSLAIIEYLDETHPEPALMPATPRERAFVRQIADIVACDIHPLNNTRILAALTQDLGVTDEQKTRWYCGWIHDGFVAIESLLAKRARQSPYCLGDSPTLADICLIPQVVNSQRFKCALDKFPTIVSIYEHAMKHPAFDRAHPMNQPGAAQK
jgi:maleylacetoacetate isomerase